MIFLTFSILNYYLEGDYPPTYSMKTFSIFIWGVNVGLWISWFLFWLIFNGFIW